MTSPAFGVAFTPYSSGGTAVSSFSLTVPAGVAATDEIVVAFAAITGALLTATGPSGFTQELSNLEGTSAQLFVFVGTGYATGATLTFTLSTAERCAACAASYPGGTFESVGAAGATSTTLADAPSITTVAANDVVVGVLGDIATTAVKAAMSGLTSGWTQRTYATAGSGTRFTYTQIVDRTLASPGASGDLSATNGGSLASTGVQLALTGSGGGGGGGGGTTAKVNVAGSFAAATPKANVGGSFVTATAKVNVAGVFT